MKGALGVIYEQDVPMKTRDKTILRSDICRPDSPGKFPVLLKRTPYGKHKYKYLKLVRSGYVVIVQDTRGRYASNGKYVPFLSRDNMDAQDGFDTVIWAAKLPYSNGKVGTFGGSYDSYLQWKLAALAPPPLKAMCAWSVPTTLPKLDWQGSFRLGRRIKWWYCNIVPDLNKKADRPGPKDQAQATKLWNSAEREKWLWLLPLNKLPHSVFHEMTPYILEWFKKPHVDTFGIAEGYSEIKVPNLDITGWYDHCNDTIGHYINMREQGRTTNSREYQKLIIGPWSHCSLGSRKVGPIDFGEQADLDLELQMIRWFDFWLKGIKNGVGEEPRVRIFVLGKNMWQNEKDWPLTNIEEKVFYLHNTENKESLSLRSKNDRAESYIYDPHDPVPTLWDSNLFTSPSDRRNLEYRPDILNFKTKILEKDIIIIGYPKVILFISSSAPDTDFFARLIDITPDCSTMDVCQGMIRARHRHSPAKNDFLTADEIYKFSITLSPTACCFKKGHRIGLEITSSDFPNYDRNHNTDKDNLSDPELVPAKQTIFYSKKHCSRLILPVRKRL